jgi:glycosyltransferase involved in cell wall biosynthesis
MLQKVPIVGSQAGAIPEILGNGKYGLLFDPYDHSNLVEKIKFARANGQAMKQMAEGAFEYANAQFSVEEMVKRTLNVYQAV